MLLDTQFDADERLDVETTALAAIAPARLDALALSVIALSWKDGLRSVLPPTRLGRIAARLFGLRPTTPLADPLLEALRRYCVLARFHHRREADAWARLHESGYRPADRDLIDALLVG